jgi:hypothetical protein
VMFRVEHGTSGRMEIRDGVARWRTRMARRSTYQPVSLTTRCRFHR